MDVTGTLRKLCTELAWDAVNVTIDEETRFDKDDLVNTVLDEMSCDLWQSEAMSKGTFDGLEKADPYLKQLVYNLVDWDEIANRIGEAEAELEQAHDDYLQDQMLNRIAMWG